jgi:hypothetical protein
MGLYSVDHMGPSTLGVDSIILSKGQIPKIFLRGVGLSEVGDAIQAYTPLEKVIPEGQTRYVIIDFYQNSLSHERK